MCAVLYALVGWLSYLGVFTPVLGVVRFWPSVFVPAVFAIAFSPYVGGVGAAIGIFISDMMIHGNALLSLTVGVPANFVAFYLTGALYRRVRSSTLPALVAEVAASLLVLALLYSWGAVPQDLLAAGGAAAAVTLALALLFKGEDRAIVLAGSTGLLAGSAIVGAGVWLFSQFFTLPTGGSRLPIVAAAVWFAWTYFTEVPFIALLTPPIVKALRRASLARQ
jgi:type IV secretory pathway TrbD component